MDECNYVQNLSRWKKVCGCCGKPIKYGEHYRMVLGDASSDFKHLSENLQPIVLNPYLCHLECYELSQVEE